MTKKTGTGYGWTDRVYYVTRISLLLGFVLMFISEVNPARIYTKMNKNVSLVTTALSYDRLTVYVKQEISRGYFMKSDFTTLMITAALMTAGIVVMSAAACVSLGNLKMKRLSNWITAAGAALSLGGCYMESYTWNLYRLIDASPVVDASGAVTNRTVAEQVGYRLGVDALPAAFYVMIGLGVLQMLCALILVIAQPRPAKNEKYEMLTTYKLFIMFLPFIILAFTFSYLPLYGWRYGFFDYSAGENLSMDNFVGFKWFGELVKSGQTRADIARVLKNTFIMSGLGIATSWVAMAFAIFLSEIRCGWFRRLIQVFTTVPNFISWVLVYAIAFAIFSKDGFINNMLTNVTGVVHDRLYLQETSALYLKMLLWGMWKGIGWSAIIYIAGISGIDQQLYEAATVDGAGRFQKMWHVTLPGLLPTYSVLLLMSVAGILSNGMDQYYVFSNAFTEQKLEVLDLYVYNIGLGSGNNIPLSTVVGMLKTLVSVVLLFAANGISKLVRGESIM